MAVLDSAVRVYVGYVVAAALALGLAAALGQVLPGGWALFVGAVAVVLLALGGAGWYALAR